MRPIASVSAVVLLCTPLCALAGSPIAVKSVSASSHYTESGNYEPERVADGKQGTAWVEGDAGAGLGAWVELDLGGEHTVDSLRIWAGDWYNDTSWNRANRPKELEVKLSDGTTEIHTLKDAREVQEIPLGGKKTSTVRLRLKSTYSGSTWPDTGISEVQVIGDGALPGHSATISASSNAPADGDGTYVAANVVDQISDSMWCEGDAGDGAGQSLTFDFGKAVPVSKLTLINGIGTSLPLWMKANRATKATLAFDSGAQTVELKPSFRPVTVSFTPVTTRKVTVTFDTVVKGAEYNDLCVSEAWFAE